MIARAAEGSVRDALSLLDQAIAHGAGLPGAIAADALRAMLGLADRGRIVREAIAVLLADLDARGRDSLLARRIVRTNHAEAGTGLDQEQLPRPSESAV